MRLDQLRVFIAVAEREHITRAAEILNLTQSAVSHAVTQLESEFQLAFFNRIGRRIELTESGRLFLTEARAILDRATTTRERMSNLITLQNGTLHVHASHTIANYWLPARLNTFHHAHPGISLHVTIDNTQTITRLIQNGDATLGLIEGDPPASNLSCTIIAHDQMLLVVAPDHPWAQTPPTPHQLIMSPWVVREKGSGTRTEFEHTLHTLGVNPDELTILLEIASNEAIASTIETGSAAAVLSANVVANRIESGLLKPVALPLPDRKFRLLQHPERHLSPAENAFIAHLGQR